MVNPFLTQIADQACTAPCPSLTFKKLALSDRAQLEDILRKDPQNISGFTFAALYSWNPIYNYEWALCGETLFISCLLPGDGQRHFLQPVGAFDLMAKAAFFDMIEHAGYPVKILGVSDHFINKHSAFVSLFEKQDDMDLANYIYRMESLSTLAGKFYAKKRNLIAQARKLYEWTVQPLTAENATDCLCVLDRIDTTSSESADTLRNEDIAVRTTIANFAALAQKGIIIKVDGKAVAFSIYEQINPDTAVIHFEKADRHYKGLYQIINQETAKAIAADGYTFINREEDLGLLGLRQAKHSYGPAMQAHAYSLTYTPSK